MAPSTTDLRNTVIVVQHTPYIGLGYFEEFFRVNSIEHIIVPIYQPQYSLPSTIQIKALIVLCADTMHHNQNNESATPAYLQDELKYIAECVHYKVPVLGICLGAKLVATAVNQHFNRLRNNNNNNNNSQLLAATTNSTSNTAGFMVQHASTTFQRDCVFSVFFDSGGNSSIFWSHGQTLHAGDVPRGHGFASSSWYPRLSSAVAIFTIRNVYGLLFHPEIREHDLIEWQQQQSQGHYGHAAILTDQSIAEVVEKQDSCKHHFMTFAERWWKFVHLCDRAISSDKLNTLWKPINLTDDMYAIRDRLGHQPDT